MTDKIRLYSDENIPNSVITGLRSRGVDVLTTKEAEKLGATDKEHLNLALKECRVILTHDEDFLKLHSQGFNHCGIVYTHQKKPIGEIIRGLIIIYHVLTNEDMENHVEFL